MMTSNVVTKEQLVTKIRQIAKDEKFRLDAYFFCGFPAGKPNSALLKACENYLATVDGGKQDIEATQKMIAELRAAVVANEKTEQIENLVDNMAEIKEVLACTEILLAV